MLHRPRGEMEAFAAAFANPDGTEATLPGYECWVCARRGSGWPSGKRLTRSSKAAGTYVDCYRFRADIIDPSWRLARRPGRIQTGRGTCPRPTGGLLLMGARPRPPWRFGRSDSQAQRCQRAGGHLGGSAQKAGATCSLNRGTSPRALAKYDAALKYAPQWGALKEARSAAAKRPAP